MMQSKTSYFNKTIWAKNITRFWPVWAIYLLIWLFALPVKLWNLMTTPQLVSQSSINVIDAMTSEIHRRTFDTGLNMAALFGILAAMAVFSYLYISKSACMYHALPVKREGLFITNYIAGLCFVIIPNVIVFIVAAIAECIGGYPAISVLISWLAVVSAMNLFFYSFGVFCAMFTGHILALPVFYGILNLIVYVVVSVVKLVLSTFVFGMSFYQSTALGILSPYYQISTMTTTVNNTISCWITIIGYALAGVALATIALMIYRKRHIETAGDIVAVRPLKPIFKYGIAFCTALILGYFLYSLFGEGSYKNNVWRMLACMVPAGFVGYYAAEMLLKKSFYVIRRGMRGWLIFSAALILLTAAMKMDVLGYESRVPDASNVSKAFIGQYIHVSSNGALVGNVNNNTVKADDASAINEIVALHENILKNKAEIVSYNNNMTASQYSLNGTQVAICYMMKDGSTLYRSYTIPVSEELLADNDSIASKFDRIFNDPGNILSREFPVNIAEINFSNGYIYPGYDEPIAVDDGTPGSHAVVNLNLNQDESYQLYQAIVKDIQTGDIGKTYLFPGKEYYNTVYTYNISLQFNGEFPGWSSSEASGNFRYFADFRLEITSKNTISALKSMGLLDESKLLTQGEARVWGRQ